MIIFLELHRIALQWESIQQAAFISFAFSYLETHSQLGTQNPIGQEL